MQSVHRYEFQVPTTAVDPNGHANNVEYVRWMQAAAIHHADAAGCTEATRKAGATWVARSHWIEYLRPLFAGDAVTILTWVANFRRARSLRKYRFVRGRDQQEIARGETEWVFVDASNGRPRTIPREVSTRFVVLPDEEARNQA